MKRFITGKRPRVPAQNKISVAIVRGKIPPGFLRLRRQRRAPCRPAFHIEKTSVFPICGKNQRAFLCNRRARKRSCGKSCIECGQNRAQLCVKNNDARCVSRNKKRRSVFVIQHKNMSAFIRTHAGKTAVIRRNTPFYTCAPMLRRAQSQSAACKYEHSSGRNALRRSNGGRKGYSRSSLSIGRNPECLRFSFGVYAFCKCKKRAVIEEGKRKRALFRQRCRPLAYAIYAITGEIAFPAHKNSPVMPDTRFFRNRKPRLSCPKR